MMNNKKAKKNNAEEEKKIAEKLNEAISKAEEENADEDLADDAGIRLSFSILPDKTHNCEGARTTVK